MGIDFSDARDVVEHGITARPGFRAMMIRRDIPPLQSGIPVRIRYTTDGEGRVIESSVHYPMRPGRARRPSAVAHRVRQ